MTEHRVLVGEVRLGGLRMVPAQHQAPPASGLDQPVPVPEGHVPEHDDPARPNAEQVQHLVLIAGGHGSA